MKKILFSLAMVAGLMAVNAQTVIWSDNFDDEDISDWTIYDEDGDGNTWGDMFQVTDGTTGEPVSPVSLISRSWQGGALTPDNWVVSPAIDLTGSTGTIALNWKVQAAAASWDLENYSIYVATESDLVSLEASDVSFSETYDDPDGNGTQYERTLDVSSFAGQTIYIAVRHHDCEDQDWLSIDDLEVVVEGGGGEDYCMPLPLDCSDGDIIMNVTFAGIDHDSDCGVDGYSDYTTEVAAAQVIAGETYDVEMEIGAGWYEKVSMWIDFDNSLTFDESERFELVEGDTGGIMTSSITIPADATEGIYRMRFFLGAVGSDNPYPADPCNGDDQGYGEIEDYMVEVGTLGMGDLDASVVAIYPNPVVDSFQVNLSSKFNANQVSVTVTDLSGKTVKTFGNQTSYNVSELPKGVYIVKITDGKNVETKKLIKK
ncbi:T9SS-dependent choice-of-anchor J family protein [Moheibacter lacus]|uniref:Choice-of-anchor J domain-containing protein n=1 Tax=Moheibacter lacus TaxID=2745851 RepID=A0A838ZSD1_9FLAO|nr:choice-of-anchor J domain-containing protein [Moheibacter lacus]MBA5629469.1 choice-of-anchor J domain-containing protein [Moheibacter lacus]